MTRERKIVEEIEVASIAQSSHQNNNVDTDTSLAQNLSNTAITDIAIPMLAHTTTPGALVE